VAGASVLSADDEAAALEALHELGCTDGLPVVVPTPERVERMAAAGGLDLDLVVAEMGPALGAATVAKLAAAAVMAGCLPDYFPLVLGAVQAVCQPEFDLTEVQATTHCLAPLVIVNGPAAAACGLASGFGALGPGFRANASIGRALRLAMMNIGGARPGVSDMALLGHPGKFTYCMAEDEQGSPFEPLHVSRGFSPEDSVVTVVGCEAPHSVVCVVDADDPDWPQRFLSVLATSLAGVGTNNANLTGGAAVVVVNPDHAAAMARFGYDRSKMAEALVELAVNRRGDLRRFNPGFVGRGTDDDIVAAFRRPEDIVIVHGGGGGLYSMVMPSWCAGPHRNPVVSQLVDLNPACEIPGMR